MKYRHSIFAVLLLMGGCVETESPTSPVLEQAVFTALGGLNVGESLTLSGPAAAAVLLGGVPVSGDFAVIPFNSSRVSGSLAVELEGQRLGSSAWEAPLHSSAGTSALEVPENAGSWRMHEELQERMKAAVEPLMSGRSRSRGPTMNLSPASDLSGSDARVGQLVELNTDVFGAPCESFDMRTGRVEAITERAIVVADVDNPSGGFERADYESFGREFDELVHPTVTAVFSDPTDIDMNDRVVIFFTRAVNELTTPGTQGYVGGFFYARDIFPKTGVDACAASNAAEIFYILVPDPGAEASHIPHTRDDVFEGALGTIGHEYQHLINASRRVWVNDANAFEETWLDEGLSHIAEELLFYAAADLAPRSNVTIDLVRSSEKRLAAINRFGVQNLVRYGLYIENVTRHSPIGGDGLETRGAAWSFLRYVADQRLDQKSDLEFFGELANSRTTGFTNLSTVLREPPVDWLQRWGVSVYTDDRVARAHDPLLQQPSWNFRSLLPAIFDGFPLDVRTLSTNGRVQLDLRSSTSGYVRFRSSPNEAAQVNTTSADAEPPEQLRVTVVRTD